MSSRAVSNAVIECVSIGLARGAPTALIRLRYDSGGQGFGGFNLKGRALYDFVFGVLAALEVEHWETLPGRIVRVDADWGCVYRIGHPLKDRWFEPAIDLAAAAPEGQ